MENSNVKTNDKLIIPHDLFNANEKESDLIKCFNYANDELSRRYNDWKGNQNSTALLMRLSSAIGRFSTEILQLTQWHQSQEKQRSDLLQFITLAEETVNVYRDEVREFSSRIY